MRHCPVCTKEIAEDATQCPYCDTQLDPATNPTSESIPSAPEQLVPRLGDLLVAKNLITETEIDRAILFQKKARENGRNVLLGEALVHLGYISKKQLDNAVTEQVFQLQDALRQANAELEQRVEERTIELQNTLEKLRTLNKLKSDFIANISHELRTPMAHIIGYVDLLRDESLGNLTQDQMMALDTIVRANDRIMVLLDDLLQFNGFTENTMKIDPTVFSLNDFLTEIKTKFKPIAKEADLNFLTEYPKEPLQVKADKEKIFWVIEQLIDNAIKFNRPQGMIKFRVRQKKQMALFQVLDTGHGIPEDKIELIFEAFVQLEGSLTRENGGTGIGLTIVKQIIEAHNSRIRVRSVEGQGTVFEFYLPLV